MGNKLKNTFNLKHSAATALVLLLLNGCSVMAHHPSEHKDNWTTSWATATEDIREGFWMSKGHFPPKPLRDDTLRMFMRTSIGGDTVRIKFSNAFGHSPVTIQHAHLAKAETPTASATNGAIKTSTDTTLTFTGKKDVVIAAGETIYSDPVAFDLAPLDVVAISIQYGDIDDKPITGHRGARTTSFFAKGNAVANSTMEAAVKKDVWYTATALEVTTAKPNNTIVAMGDSITDGYGTHYNHHTRWTDFLAERLVNNPQTADVAMANVGIGGAGSAMSIERFQRDVLDIKGAGWLIIFIGINDIVYGDNRPASYVIEHYKKMAEIAHAHGIKVYGATITPMGKHSENADKESVRQQVNTWIRTTSITEGVYDGVIDFDKIARDPQRPNFLLAEYAVDDLHLNVSGYKALADAVELKLFIKPNPL